MLREFVVSQHDSNDATNREEQRIEKIPEDVRPMESSFEDDCLACLEALFDVIRHSFKYFLCKDSTFLLTKQETRQKVYVYASFISIKKLSLQKHYTFYN